jgi:hypothetical protein
MARTKTAEVERLYRQLEGALSRVPDDRRRQLATELVQQEAAEGAGGLMAQMRRAVLASGLSVFAISRRAEIDYGKLRKWLSGDGDLRGESLDRIGRVLGLRVVVVDNTEGGGT